MTQIVVCDVCDERFNPEEFEGVQMSIPEELTLSFGVNGGVFDVCSWACVRKLVDLLDPQMDDEPIAYQLADEQQPLGLADPDPEPEVPDYEVPATGVYFPAGIRVDGKDPSQLPKLKVKR